MFFAIFQSPFLSGAASFENKWPLSAEDYTSFRKRSGNSNLVANPTINTWTETHVLQGAGLHQASLLQPYKTFSSDSHARFVPCCHQWCPDHLQLLLPVLEYQSCQPQCCSHRCYYTVAAHGMSRSEMTLLKGSSSFSWMSQLRA